MAEQIAERHRIAVELLAIAPRDRILEIGCGSGVATTLALAALATGHLTAIDRSAKMAAATAKRNADAVAGGRLAVLTGNFEETGFAPFDKVFAVNVDLPLHRDIGWAARLRAIVVPRGVVVLILEAPVAATADRFARDAAKALAAEGFATEVTRRPPLASVRAVRL